MIIRRPAPRIQTPLPKPATSPSAAMPAPVRRNLDSFRAVLTPAKQVNLLSLEKLMPQRCGAARTEADALKEADLLLLGGPANREANGAEILRDAPDVNSSLDTNAANARHQAAQAQLEANKALEEARLEKLSPADRASYAAVQKSCLDANDPVAAVALQKMLFEGKLPGAKDLAGEGTTLEHLASLANECTPLAEGIDRGQLVSDLVQELATPAAINQGQRRTCAPTTIAIQLAINDPAEYVRITAGLASPEGTVVLAGGQTLTREDGTATDDGSRRSTSQRLMGSAFMELGNGDTDYQNDTGDGAGAWSDKLDVLYEAVMGRPMSDQRLTTDEERANAMGIIDTQLRAGASVPVALSWGEGYHKVLVTGSETINGQEYVKYLNPWGREEQMLRTDFEQRLADISYDPRAQLVGQVLQGVDGVKDFFDNLFPSNLVAETERNRRAAIVG